MGVSAPRQRQHRGNICRRKKLSHDSQKTENGGTGEKYTLSGHTPKRAPPPNRT